MKATQRSPLLLVTNKKAHFSYTICHTYTAGIVLDGPEVKSIRLHKAQLQGAYCYFYHNELWLRGMHVSPYPAARHYRASPTRPRKLLLQRRELNKLYKQKRDKGLTMVPLRVSLSDQGKIKVEVALARGKRRYDKRAAIKERDIKRRMRKKVVAV